MASSEEDVFTFNRAKDCTIIDCSFASSSKLKAPVKSSSAANVILAPTPITGTMPSFFAIFRHHRDTQFHRLLARPNSRGLPFNKDIALPAARIYPKQALNRFRPP